jgi:hypothetical protein
MITRFLTIIAVVLLGMVVATEAWSCSVCFGADPTSTQYQGLFWAVMVLLAVVLSVLGGFAIFFLNLRKRSRQKPA